MAVAQVTAKKKSFQERCKICSKEHWLWSCSQLKALPVNQRWNKAREFRVCFSWLSTFYLSSSCRRAKCCSIDVCGSGNYNIKELHVENDDNGSLTLPRDWKGGEPESSTFVSSVSDCKEYLPLRTIPVIFRNGNKSWSINALLDDESTRSYINEDMSDWLGLIGEPVSMNVRLLKDRTASLTI